MVTHSPPTSFFPFPLITKLALSCSSTLDTGVPDLPLFPSTLDGLGPLSIGRPDGVVGRDPAVGLIVLEAGPTEEGRGIPLAGLPGIADGVDGAGPFAAAKAEGGADAEAGKDEPGPADGGGATPPTRFRWVRVSEKIACEREDWAFMSVSFVRRRAVPERRLAMTSSFEATLISLRPDQMMCPSLSSRIDSCGRSEAGIDGSDEDSRSSRSSL